MTTTNPIGQVLKSKSPWTAILMALFIIYVLVSQLVPARTSDDINVRLIRLETAVQDLKSTPQALATLTEATNTLKLSVDRLGEKLDRHIAKDVR